LYSDDYDFISNVNNERSLLSNQLKAYETTAQFIVEILANSRWSSKIT